MKYIICVLLFIITSGIYGQRSNRYVSKIELQKDSLYDYGYGLQKFDSLIDSVFCYNDFYNKDISFRELDSFVIPNGYTVHTTIVNDQIKNIELLFNDKLVDKLIIPKQFENYSYVDHAYEIKSNYKKYILAYLVTESMPSIWNSYLGILFDLEEMYITIFPELLNTSSPLPLTMLADDNKLNLIVYLPSEKNTIDIYTLKDRIFIRDKKNSCHLLSSDGFIWKIDFRYQNFISDFYKNKQ